MTAVGFEFTLFHYSASVTDLDADQARFDAEAIFVLGHKPFAAAFVLFDPDTGAGQSAVVASVAAPPAAALLALGLLGACGARGRCAR